ncbi:hypothetical protein Lser_V15G01047 [Lactuca serriola]
MMRTLCPNVDNEDALETVLEVPIPEETFDDNKINHKTTSWKTLKSWMKPYSADPRRQFSDYGGRNADIHILLGVVGAPLVALPISFGHPNIIDNPIGLDLKATANLFDNSICIGEKTINAEDCFVLKLEAELSTLKHESVQT